MQPLSWRWQLPKWAPVLQPQPRRRVAPLGWSRGFLAPGCVRRLEAADLLSKLNDDSAGAIFIDPPPDIGLGDTENLPAVEEQIYALASVAEQAMRILRPGGVAFSMGDPRVMSAWDLAAARVGLSLVNELVVLWCKPPMRRPHAISNLPSLNVSIRRYVKPGLRGVFNPSSVMQVQSNVLVCHPVPEVRRAVVWQRPVELFNYLIDVFTNPDDLVVDPMCGTGSVLVAAELNGRPWIGGDKEAEWCQLARVRTGVAEVEELERIGHWNGDEIHWIEG